MTDRIDLDDLGGDEPDDDDGNRGDWLWREDADPSDGADATDEAGGPEPSAGPDGADGSTDQGTAETAGADRSTADTAGEQRGETVPHVPRTNKDRPVGIPKEQGGAGGATAREDASDGAAPPDAETEPGESAAGPHGGGVDDMTMALTYRAARRLANPAAVFADAATWADWVGIVGEVDAHVINKFQRDHHIDADFFNGSGTGPDERLAEIDRHSMFYAERMVVVGLDDDAWIAEAADWEFVPLSEAAAEADWELDGA